MFASTLEIKIRPGRNPSWNSIAGFHRVQGHALWTLISIKRLTKERQCVPTAAHSVIQNTKHALEADTLKRMKSEGSNVYVQRHINRHTTTEGHCSIDGGRRLKGGDRGDAGGPHEFHFLDWLVVTWASAPSVVIYWVITYYYCTFRSFYKLSSLSISEVKKGEQW